MELFQKYDVFVISDEIWSDLILNGHKHIPTQSVSEDAKNRTIALYAPSKTFNLAGLIGSYHIIYNSWLKDRIDKESSLCHYNDMNVLSMHALIGAYKPEGHESFAAAGFLPGCKFYPKKQNVCKSNILLFISYQKSLRQISPVLYS